MAQLDVSAFSSSCDDRPLAGRLMQAEPLEARRQVAHEFALAPPAQRFAPRHHRRERHHDAGQAKPRHQCAVERAHDRATGDRSERHKRHGPSGFRHQPGEDAAQRELRTGGDVDLPRDDDERHAARSHEHRRGSGERGKQLLPAKESGRYRSENNEQRAERSSYGPFSKVSFQRAITV